MNNLLDELHELDKDEYSMSPSFSNDVMKKIKKKNKIIKFSKFIAGFGCTAAVLLAVFVFYKSGRLGLVNNVASTQSNGIDLVTTAGEIEDAAFVSNDNFEKNRFKEDAPKNAPMLMNYDSAVTEEAVSKESEDALLDEVTREKSVEQTYKKEQTIISEYNKEDYLNEIKNLLTNNEYSFSINDDEQIIIHSQDVNKIKELLKEYLDIKITSADNEVIISIK